jgi:hypothetical protein
MFKDSIYIGSNCYVMVDTDFTLIIQCEGATWESWTDQFIELYESRGLNVAGNFVLAVKHFGWLILDERLPETRKLDPYIDDITKYLMLM